MCLNVFLESVWGGNRRIERERGDVRICGSQRSASGVILRCLTPFFHMFSWSEVGLLGQADCPVRSSDLPACLCLPALELHVHITRPRLYIVWGIELWSSCSISSTISTEQFSHSLDIFEYALLCSCVQ